MKYIEINPNFTQLKTVLGCTSNASHLHGELKSSFHLTNNEKMIIDVTLIDDDEEAMILDELNIFCKDTVIFAEFGTDDVTLHWAPRNPRSKK